MMKLNSSRFQPSSGGGKRAERRRGAPPDYLSRRMQRRLLMLVALLAAVLVLMSEARNPAHWQWLWHLDRAAAVSPLAENPIGLPAGDAETAPENGAAPQPVLDRQQLDTIQDDTYFRAEESDIWFQLLDWLGQRSPDALARRSVGRVSHLQLNEQMESYRGHLVRVDGTVHRASQVEAPPNTIGLERYWQLWIQADNGPALPIVVYALQMPPGFPEQQQMDEPVSVVGVAFKRWAYVAEDGLRVAPVLLAKTAAWQPPQAAPRASVTSRQLLLLVGAAMSLALLALLAFLWQSRGARPRRAQQLPPRLTEPDWTAIRSAGTPNEQQGET